MVHKSKSVDKGSQKHSTDSYICLDDITFDKDNLSPEQIAQLQQVFHICSVAFVDNDDKLGESDIKPHTIEFKQGGMVFYNRPYRVSPRQNFFSKLSLIKLLPTVS